MLAATFIDPKLEREINNNGFIVIPNFISGDEIKYLLELFNSHHNKETIGFWNSVSHLSTDLGLEVSEKIKAIVNPRFEELLKDWKFPVAQFIVKNPGQNNESTVHRDYSVHDEEKVQYRQVWVPLVDLTKDNGVLYVVPRSHQLFTGARPMFAKWPYEHLIPRLEQEFYPIYAKAGDLILYLDKTLHGSFKNFTSEPRPAFTGGIIHNEANILYARYIEERSEVESYEADSAFFYNREFEKPVIDKKYPFLKTEKYRIKEITGGDLDKFYGTC